MRRDYETLKEEFRFLGNNLIPLTEAMAEKIWSTYEHYLHKYPFLKKIAYEVDPHFYCPRCGAPVDDWSTQMLRANQIVCENCGATIYKRLKP